MIDGFLLQYAQALATMTYLLACNHNPTNLWLLDSFKMEIFFLLKQSHRPFSIRLVIKFEWLSLIEHIVYCHRSIICLCVVTDKPSCDINVGVISKRVNYNNPQFVVLTITLFNCMVVFHSIRVSSNMGLHYRTCMVKRTLELEIGLKWCRHE